MYVFASTPPLTKDAKAMMQADVFCCQKMQISVYCFQMFPFFWNIFRLRKHREQTLLNIHLVEIEFPCYILKSHFEIVLNAIVIVGCISFVGILFPSIFFVFLSILRSPSICSYSNSL